MQERGESSAQVPGQARAQPEPSGWGGAGQGSSQAQQQPSYAPPAGGQQQGYYQQPPTVSIPMPGPMQAPQAPPAPPAPPAKGRPRWKTPVLMGVALVVGIAIGAAAGGSKDNDSSTVAGSSGTSSTSSSSTAAAGGAGAKSAAPAKTAGAPAVAAGPAKSVVLQTSGNGQKTSKTFTVAGDWSVKYTYNCASFGYSGSFAVMEHGGDLDGLPIINTSGNKGGDVSYQHHDAGQRSLEVNSECDWTLTVTSGDAG